MFELLLAIYVINLIIMGICALVTYALFNMIFVDPIEQFTKKVKNKVKSFFKPVPILGTIINEKASSRTT